MKRSRVHETTGIRAADAPEERLPDGFLRSAVEAWYLPHLRTKTRASRSLQNPGSPEPQAWLDAHHYARILVRRGCRTRYCIGKKKAQSAPNSLGACHRVEQGKRHGKTNDSKTCNRHSSCCATARLSFQHRDSSRQTPPPPCCRHRHLRLRRQPSFSQPAGAPTRRTRLTDRS